MLAIASIVDIIEFDNKSDLVSLSAALKHAFEPQRYNKRIELTLFQFLFLFFFGSAVFTAFEHNLLI